jgi:hypothetical protein
MARPSPAWLFAKMYSIADGKEWSTDFWYGSAGGTPPSNFDPVSLAAAVYGALSGGIQGIMSMNYALVGCQIEVNFGTGTFGAKSYQNTAGALSTGPLPEDVCLVVRKLTAMGGRSHTGVNRYSGLDESLSLGSYLSSAGVSAAAVIKTNTLAHVVNQTITWIPQVYSRKLNLLEPITGMETISLLGTARRRRPVF